MFLDNRGRPIPFLMRKPAGVRLARRRSCMLKLAHEIMAAAWAPLQPAMQLALEGFEVSPRLATLLAAYRARAAARRFWHARLLRDREGNPLQAGAVLRNPQYALTLRALAERAATLTQARSRTPLWRSPAQSARRALTHADLQAVEEKRRPVCGAYRIYRACTVGPPSSGNAVLAIQALWRARPQPGGLDNADDWSAFLWATASPRGSRSLHGRRCVRACADARVIAPAILMSARLIDLTRAPTSTPPGMPAGPGFMSAGAAQAGMTAARRIFPSSIAGAMRR